MKFLRDVYSNSGESSTAGRRLTHLGCGMESICHSGSLVNLHQVSMAKKRKPLAVACENSSCAAGEKAVQELIKSGVIRTPPANYSNNVYSNGGNGRDTADLRKSEKNSWLTRSVCFP